MDSESKNTMSFGMWLGETLQGLCFLGDQDLGCYTQFFKVKRTNSRRVAGRTHV